MHEFWKRDSALWILAAVAVGLNAAAGSYNVRRMEQTERLLYRTRTTHAELSALLSDIIDAETGHRGYLLTGREEYLEPFHRAEAGIGERQERVRELVTDHPKQLERLDTAGRLVRDKFSEMRRSIGIRGANGVLAAANVVTEGRGKQIMDQFRIVMHDMLAEEEGRLTERAKAAENQYQTAEYNNLLGAALAITVLAAAAVLGRMELRRRERLNRSLAAEKQKTEEALGAFDSFVRNAPYGIAYFDSDLNDIRVNDVFARTSRGQADGAFGRPLPVVLPDFQADLLADFRRVIDTGVGLNNRLVYAPTNIWEVTAFPVPLAGGRRGLGVIGVDVTERQLSDSRLRESEGRFRSLTEAMPQIVWVARGDGYREYYNARWHEYTGLTPEQSLGREEWVAALHPDDRERGRAAWRRAIESGTVYEVEYRFRRHDGEYQWFLGRAVPVRDDGGRIVRWLGTCTGIHERKQHAEILERMVGERTAELNTANIELRQQQIFLDAILDNVAEGIVACDADGRLKLFNVATRDMHGLPAEPLSPDRWPEFYHLYEADGVTPMPTDRVPLFRAWRGEQVRDSELVIRAHGRPDRYVLCSGQQLRTAAGDRFGAVVSMRDMTVRREYERQLLVTSAALKVSNEELEKFAYIASHDLQEPLRKIQAFGTRLADKHRAALGEQGIDYIERMLDSAGRMRRLIEDLLSFSRVSSKAAPFQPVDLNAVVRDVLSDLEVRIQSSGGRVDVGPLPTVSGDAVQLRQVFQNLIGNALKFARPEVPPVVRVSSARFEHLPGSADPPPPNGPGWRITIADNGIGFEQEYGERIFELFQRLHARSEYEGTGLGLAIVRKIIGRHGATVAARSQPGAGATFTLDWPTTG